MADLRAEHAATLEALQQCQEENDALREASSGAAASAASSTAVVTASAALVEGCGAARALGLHTSTDGIDGVVDRIDTLDYSQDGEEICGGVDVECGGDGGGEGSVYSDAGENGDVGI